MGRQIGDRKWFGRAGRPLPSWGTPEGTRGTPSLPLPLPTTPLMPVPRAGTELGVSGLPYVLRAAPRGWNSAGARRDRPGRGGRGGSGGTDGSCPASAPPLGAAPSCGGSSTQQSVRVQSGRVAVPDRASHSPHGAVAAARGRPTVPQSGRAPRGSAVPPRGTPTAALTSFAGVPLPRD